MKIRIVDILPTPNITGSANINDAKAMEIINLFLDAIGVNAATEQEKLDNMALELKRHVIRVAKEYLRYTRTAAFEATLNSDSSQYD